MTRFRRVDPDSLPEHAFLEREFTLDDYGKIKNYLQIRDIVLPDYSSMPTAIRRPSEIFREG
jgi:hypothetical protein